MFLGTVCALGGNEGCHLFFGEPDGNLLGGSVQPAQPSLPLTSGVVGARYFLKDSGIVERLLGVSMLGDYHAAMMPADRDEFISFEFILGSKFFRVGPVRQHNDFPINAFEKHIASAAGFLFIVAENPRV